MTPSVEPAPVLHRERPGLWPIWAWLALTAVGFAAFLLAGDANGGYGLLLAAGIIGLFGVVPLVLSRRRYSAVTVTPEELRVGTEAFALRDLDPRLLERQLGGGLDASPRWSLRPGEGVTMAGGAWGPTLGERHLLVEAAGRAGTAAVPTRDVARLARTLLDARTAAISSSAEADSAPGSSGASGSASGSA